MSDAAMRGPFVWHELMTTDTKSAAAFYSKTIGWKTKPWGEDGSYTLLLMGGQQMAGLMVQPQPGAPPAWLTYIGTPSVDDTVRQAVSLGAMVHKQPSDIPTIGRFATLQDPQGAIFAVFTPLPGQPAPPDQPAALGDFSWHELATTDWRAALTFYQALFGWQETTAMDMGPGMGTYQMFGRSGRTLGGVFTKPAQMPGPPSWLPYIRVVDTKQTAKTVKKLGGRIVNGPMEVPGGDWIAQGLDLQGATFAVDQVSVPASVPPPAPAKAAATKAGARAARTATAKVKAAKGKRTSRRRIVKAANAATRKTAGRARPGKRGAAATTRAATKTTKKRPATKKPPTVLRKKKGGRRSR